MDEFRATGERIIEEMYQRLIEWLDDDAMEWADDSAVWYEVFEKWADGLVGTPYDYSWRDWLDVADYIVGTRGTEHPVYVYVAHWLCERWNSERYTAKHMRVDEGLAVLLRVYDGIMDQWYLVSHSPEDWTDDFIRWWEANEHDGIDLTDLDLISAYLGAEGRLEGHGLIFAIGEWLYEHNREIEG